MLSSGRALRALRVYLFCSCLDIGGVAGESVFNTEPTSQICERCAKFFSFFLHLAGSVNTTRQTLKLKAKAKAENEREKILPEKERVQHRVYF